VLPAAFGTFHSWLIIGLPPAPRQSAGRHGRSRRSTSRRPGGAPMSQPREESQQRPAHTTVRRAAARAHAWPAQQRSGHHHLGTSYIPGVDPPPSPITQGPPTAISASDHRVPAQNPSSRLNSRPSTRPSTAEADPIAAASSDHPIADPSQERTGLRSYTMNKCGHTGGQNHSYQRRSWCSVLTLRT
jgi:hypothetical protein